MLTTSTGDWDTSLVHGKARQVAMRSEDRGRREIETGRRGRGRRQGRRDEGHEERDRDDGEVAHRSPSLALRALRPLAVPSRSPSRHTAHRKSSESKTRMEIAYI
ncbi:hypothetical protein THAOC_30686 [Thalassiosira oceanica]|uniref:Uncharacterized protein n=1 Tax=Thalassiosira oceanica TaxID=159749 RepID=K0RUK8_THAOC|nr:hypothetical protein THAOC_30686 [Thalassiosira oceanica]|eukprot:EJK50357.1 hypothetical protein THAOC_30686 [Thalassiosira oceanica]